MEDVCMIVPIGLSVRLPYYILAYILCYRRGRGDGHLLFSERCTNFYHQVEVMAMMGLVSNMEQRPSNVRLQEAL